MKKIILLLIAVATIATLWAQSPQSFKYQAVARDAGGQVLQNQNVSFLISLLQGSAAGTAVYTEGLTATTNDLGLFSLGIGNGVPVLGNFTTIDWGASPYFMKVEMDENGGNNFTWMGTTQLMSVPYALYAETAGNGSAWETNANDVYYNNGNVGVGTDVPETGLHLDNEDLRLTGGQIDFGDQARVIKYTAGDYMSVQSPGAVTMVIDDNNNNTNMAFSVRKDDFDPEQATELFRVQENGTVGIGNSNPSTGRRLHMTGGDLLVEAEQWADMTVRVTQTGTDAAVVLRNVTDGNWSNDNYWYIGNKAANNALSFQYITDKKMTLSKEGNLGIGTTDPQARLDVAGRIQQSGIGNSVFIGPGAGENDDLVNNPNLAIGAGALHFNTNRSNHIAIGDSALHHNGLGATQGYHANNNLAIGPKTLFSNTTGSNNIALGVNSLYSNLSGGSNIAIGVGSLAVNSVGASNIAIGNAAQFFNNTGNENIALGSYSLYNNATGYSNVAIGSYALYRSPYNFHNVAIGDSALYYSGEGSTSSYYGSNNVGIGSKAMFYNTEGKVNVAIGVQSNYSNTTGSENAAVGFRALYSNTTGGGNTAVGMVSLRDNSSGYRNTACGSVALVFNTTGVDNTACGFGALYNNTTGSTNTAIGTYAFYSGSNYSNSTGLGYYAEPGGSNRIMLGNSSVTWIGGHSTWYNTSDERVKKNISEDVKGLDFILKLRPVTYYFDKDRMDELIRVTDSSEYSEKYNVEKIRQSGFLAQEVEEAAQSSGYDFSGVKSPEGDVKYYSLSYSEFVVPLVKAVQEQQALIEELQEEIRALKSQK